MTDYMKVDGADSELVGAVLGGDRAAFGRIVERYQSLLCAIAYSATGNLAQSEDCAQEAFVIAWKQLASLQEPARLRSWLCGIARNIANNTVRRRERDAVSHAEPLEEITDSAAAQTPPSDQVITAEEERILWRSLESIPEIYREPIVLFYREGQSIHAVSQELELTEDTVKQRLSRGRKLLRDEVANFVEGTLQRSRPGGLFTAAVLAALPAATISTSAATFGAAAADAAMAKTTAAGSASSVLAGALIGPALGLLGGYIGARASIQNTRSERERRFVIRLAWIAVAIAIIFSFLVLVLVRNGSAWLASHPRLYVSSIVVVILGYVFGLCVLIFWASRRQAQIRLEQEPRLPATAATSGYEYRSKTTILGWPLIHIKTGGPSGRGIATGWIAVGDIAAGIIFAMGGVACGGIALGGLGLGLFSFAGAAFGAWVVGGWAMGFEAFGGGAIGWHSAFGGLAIAHDYAQGGLALAANANNAVAANYFQSHGFAPFARTLMKPEVGWVVMLLPILITAIIQTRKTRHK